jgi:glycerol-3-phosphate acyltransferase PlsX
VIKDEVKKALKPIHMRPLYLVLPIIFKTIRQDYSPEKYATAPLLGVNGNVMICHGASRSDTIKNALLNVPKYVDSGLNSLIEKEIERCASRYSEIVK